MWVTNKRAIDSLLFSLSSCFVSTWFFQRPRLTQRTPRENWKKISLKSETILKRVVKEKCFKSPKRNERNSFGCVRVSRESLMWAQIAQGILCESHAVLLPANFIAPLALGRYQALTAITFISSIWLQSWHVKFKLQPYRAILIGQFLQTRQEWG